MENGLFLELEGCKISSKSDKTKTGLFKKQTMAEFYPSKRNHVCLRRHLCSLPPFVAPASAPLQIPTFSGEKKKIKTHDIIVCAAQNTLSQTYAADYSIIGSRRAKPLPQHPQPQTSACSGC